LCNYGFFSQFPEILSTIPLKIAIFTQYYMIYFVNIPNFLTLAMTFYQGNLSLFYFLN
jgi:hypothetical protein